MATCWTIAFAALLASTPAMAMQGSSGPLVPVRAGSEKQSAFEAAARLAGAASELSRLWPGYWREGQGFIIQIAGEGALLVTSGAPPAGFETIGQAGLPPALKGRAYFHKGILPDTARPFTIGYPLGEGRTGVLLNVQGRTAEQIVGTILHEQFHGYQSEAFKNRTGGQFVDPLAIKDRVAFAASAEVEQHVLAAALAAPSELERRALLRSYFALRREREGTMPAAAIAVERGFEKSEGTALYIERLAQARLGAGGDPALAALLKERLEFKFNPNTPFVTQWFRQRGYGTGAALTYLISRYGPENWRASIEAGANLDELLEKAIGKTGPDASRLAAEARERFGYEARRRALEPGIRAAEKSEIKSVEEFLALAPYRLVLDASAFDGRIESGFSAQNMTPLTPTTMALALAGLFSATAPGLSLTARERPVLMEGAEKRYTLLLQAPVEVSGPSLAPGEHRLERLAIDAGGVALEIERPVLVTVGEKMMIVKLLAG